MATHAIRAAKKDYEDRIGTRVILSLVAFAVPIFVMIYGISAHSATTATLTLAATVLASIVLLWAILDRPK